MGDPLHDRQSVRVLASSRQSIEINGKIEDFERLSSSVGSDLATLPGGAVPAGWRARPVTGRVRFDVAPGGGPTLTGQLAATVPAVCQRCLEPFEYRLDEAVALQFGTGAAPAPEQAQPGFEFWELPEERARPLDIVDELLVMAMPLSARHTIDDNCRAPDETGAGRKVTRPFADLRRQLENPGKEQ